MAFILPIEEPWTSQPQGAVEIDWSNPLTRGLVVADCAQGQYLAAGTKTINRLGVGLNGKFVLNQRAISSGIANSTIVQIIYYSAPPAWNSDLTCFTYADTSNVYPNDIGLRLSSSTLYGNAIVYARDSGGSGRYTRVDVISGNLAAGDVAFYAAAIDNSQNVVCYGAKNYDPITSGSSSGLSGYTFNAPSSGNPFIGAYDATYEPGAHVVFTARWTRALSAIEIASIRANPWQIFVP